MFCLRTDRFSLTFPHRCASRTITASLLGETHTEINKSHKEDMRECYLGIDDVGIHSVRRVIKTSSNITNIMVLRNPKDRFIAGKGVADSMMSVGKINTEEDHFNVFRIHAAPVYYHFIDALEVDYKIILFDRIGEYFPGVHEGAVEKPKKTPRWLKKYDNYFNHWQEEIDAYNFILNNKKQIEPEIFRSLLKDSSYINMKNVNNKRYKPLFDSKRTGFDKGFW